MLRSLTLILLLASFPGCREKKPTLKTYEMTVMNMQLRVKTPRRGKVEAIIKKTFKQIDQTFNNWNPKSEISQVNQLSDFQEIKISQSLAELLRRVGEIVEISDGRFDPTVAPLVHMWKTHLQNGEIPSDEAISALKPAIGWDKIHLEGNVLFKEDARTQIDLCGIAKGYAVDLLLERLGEHSYVEWGGEIATSDCHPSGRLWRVKIFGGDIVEIEDKAVATSGSYLQRFWAEGKQYTHIIDPHHSQPLEYGHGLFSATVIGRSCMEADALATALMLFPTREEAEAWANKKGLKVQLIPYTPDLWN